MVIEFFVGFVTLILYVAAVVVPVAVVTYFVGPAINYGIDYNKATRENMKKDDWCMAFLLVAFVFVAFVVISVASVELGRNILQAKYGVSD